MTPDQVVMFLTFFAGVLALASQMLDVSPDVAKLIAFGVAVINLALATFYGKREYQARKATRAGIDRANELMQD